MKDRIREIIDWANLSQQDFANRLGISPASLSSIFTGRTNPTNNHVQAIHRVFPEINVNWLLFGEGDMLGTMTTAESGSSSLENPIKAGEGAVLPEVGKMASMFSDEDYSLGTMGNVPTHSTGSARRETSSNRVAGIHYIDNVKNIDKRVRRIKEIRVFFDDGTYEAFIPSSGK